MSDSRQRRIERLLPFVAIVVASVFISDLISHLAFFQSFRLKLQDQHFAFRSPIPSKDIVLLVIDQKSISAFTEPIMFWHKRYAAAIDAAAKAGAKVFGLGITFGAPTGQWAAGNDEALAAAVTSKQIIMPVVCGIAPAGSAERVAPVPVNLAAAALGLDGVVQMEPDPDDFIRSFEAISPPAHSFALRVAEKYLRAQASLDGNALLLGDRRIPLEPGRRLLINYNGPTGTFPRMPLADFLEAAGRGEFDRLRQFAEGKIVLLGRDASEDRRSTPFFNHDRGPAAKMSAVEIHANAIATLLDQRLLRQTAASIQWIGLVLCAGLTLTLVAVFPLRQFLLALALWIGCIFAGTHLLFRMGWLLSTSDLVLTSGVACCASLLYYTLSTRRQKAALEHAMDSLAGKKITTRVVERESLAITSRMQMVTIIFSDIRGFTAFCESQQPEAVLQILNSYFEKMVSFVTRRRGTVNKFLGDGLMAIFSADEGEDHAERAVRCAMEMIESEHRFQTRVGIHSGPAIVGLVGTGDRMEHTALGDTVNLASRLEELNREQNTQVLMSAATQIMLPGNIETEYLGEMQIRGSRQMIKVYTLKTQSK